jgi:geranylgeranyl diphosphate synthase type II
MASLEDLREKIDERIDRLNFSRSPRELYDPISYTLGLGGKRLRPALCLLACDLVGGRVEEALDPAIGIEIFHNFTLLHDDIMDKAPIRRGKETVHVRWNPNAAILSGDTMMALAYEYIMKAPEHLRSAVFSVFNKTAIEVCEGQQYDMNFETAVNIGIADYMEMIRLKTAVLLAGSLKIGALIGGAEKTVASELYAFGENIGIAFQLKDDLLDVFSKEEKFGKTTGGDIITNKKTYLYLKAFELAGPGEHDQLVDLFSDEYIAPEEKVSRVTDIYERLEIKKHTEEQIDLYYNKAMAALHKIEFPDDRKAALLKFSDQLRKRDS